jgi:hypothetical protein
MAPLDGLGLGIKRGGEGPAGDQPRASSLGTGVLEMAVGIGDMGERLMVREGSFRLRF